MPAVDVKRSTPLTKAGPLVRFKLCAHMANGEI